jgi:hypothetical protein
VEDLGAVASEHVLGAHLQVPWGARAVLDGGDEWSRAGGEYMELLEMALVRGES